VIGGRVLDESFLVAFASRTSVYAEAAVWAAVNRSVVLVVPSSAMAVAAAQLTTKDVAVLEVLLALPVTVADELTFIRARAVAEVAAELGADLVTAHVVACARDRGWPILTAEPDRYHGRAGVEVEPLP
jgi:predicted nucleic acid-binding protein